MKDYLELKSYLEIGLNNNLTTIGEVYNFNKEQLLKLDESSYFRKVQLIKIEEVFSNLYKETTFSLNSNIKEVLQWIQKDTINKIRNITNIIEKIPEEVIYKTSINPIFFNLINKQSIYLLDIKDLFKIYQESENKSDFEKIFKFFTNMEFTNYLDLCENFVKNININHFN